MSTSLKKFSVNLEDEMKQSYLDYVQSCWWSRIPDVRDGLKPVHRVCYIDEWVRHDWNKPYKKIRVLSVMLLVKSNPHAIRLFMTRGRMAQSFTMRYMLVDGQGNLARLTVSTCGMRYTKYVWQKLPMNCWLILIKRRLILSLTMMSQRYSQRYCLPCTELIG